MADINEMIIAYHHPDDPIDGSGGSCEDHRDDENSGMLILDATCAPQNISFPQDINLLNDGRMQLEQLIDTIRYEFGYYRSWMYGNRTFVDRKVIQRKFPQSRGNYVSRIVV